MEHFINKYFSGNTLLFSFTLHLLLFIISYVIFTPYYQTNDDVGMMMYLRGIGTLNNQPTEHVLFIHIVLSKFLKALTLLFGRQTDFYTWFLVITLLISYTVLGYLYLKKYKKWYHLLLYISFFLIFGLQNIISLQFTVVAAITGFMGWLLLVNRFFISGAFMLLLATLLRWESAVMVLPVVILYIYKSYSDYNKTINIVFGIFIMIFATFLISYSNKVYYNSFSQYYDYNGFRVNIVDYQIFDKLDREQKDLLFSEIKWSENDYQMLMDFFFMDNKKYSLDKLKRVSDLYKQDSNHIYHLSRPGTYYHVNKYFFSRGMGMIYLIFSSVLIFLFFTKRNITFAIVITSTIAFIIALINYFFKFPPDRIINPLFFCGSFLMLVSLQEKEITRDFIKYIASFAVILLSIYQVREYYRKDKDVKQWRITHQDMIKQLNPQKKELYIVWGDNFRYEHLPLFHPLDYLDNLTLFSLGSLQRFDEAKKLLAAYRINNIYIDIIGRNDIKLMCNNRQLEMYKKYLQENYGIAVQESQVFYSGYFNVYTFQNN